jgi:hypothetical protein
MKEVRGMYTDWDQVPQGLSSEWYGNPLGYVE